jgi:cell fate regulator YaaT (PSP1 superfamily)
MDRDNGLCRTLALQRRNGKKTRIKLRQWGVRGDDLNLNNASNCDAENMLSIQVKDALHDSHSHINASKCFY